MPRWNPTIDQTAFLRALEQHLPGVPITVIDPEGTLVVDGPVGAYAVTVTSEHNDLWETVHVEVSFHQPPGFTEPLARDEQMPLPHGMYSLTGDMGRHLRVDYRALAQGTFDIISRFEEATPSLSGGVIEASHPGVIRAR